MRLPALHLIAFTVLLAAALPAQRRPAFVRVTDAQGQPVAGAEVTCCSLLVRDPWLQPPDVVRVATDARGRARVDLQVSAGYAAFAVGVADAAGRRAASGIAELAAGAVLELRLLAGSGARTLQLDGLAQWGGLAPVRARLAIGGLPLRPEVPIADGRATLPPLPAVALQLELLDARGDLFCSTWVEPTAVAVTLPPLRTVPCAVVDDQGAPAAGVEVWLRTADGHASVLQAAVGDQWHLGGTTGADGTVEVKAPSAEDPFGAGYGGTLWFAARRAGCAESLSGWFYHRRFHDGEFAGLVQPGAALRFTMRPQPPWTGRLAGSSRLLLTAQVKVDRNTSATLFRCQRAVAAADGSYWFPALAGGAQALQLFAGTAAAGAGQPAPLLPAIESAAALPSGDLAAAATVSLQVQSAQKAPAQLAHVLLLAMAGKAPIGSGPGVRLRLDTAGRAAFRAMPGRWFLFVHDGRGYAAQVVEVGIVDQQLALQMQPLGALRGRLLDDRSLPVAGARFALDGAIWGGAKVPALDPCLQAVASSVNAELLDAGCTGSDGRFELGFLPIPGMRPQVVARTGAARSPAFELQDGGDVEVRLGR